MASKKCLHSSIQYSIGPHCPSIELYIFIKQLEWSSRRSVKSAEWRSSYQWWVEIVISVVSNNDIRTGHTDRISVKSLSCMVTESCRDCNAQGVTLVYCVSVSASLVTNLAERSLRVPVRAGAERSQHVTCDDNCRDWLLLLPSLRVRRASLLTPHIQHHHTHNETEKGQYGHTAEILCNFLSDFFINQFIN